MNEKVIVIDAGTGNLRSVWIAVKSLGCEAVFTRDPADVRHGSRVILPGVGAFGAFMQGLRTSGMAEAVLEAARSGMPLLGICVGMQALCDMGLEGGTHQGLGLLEGTVEHFPAQNGLKMPHTGWNQLQFTGDTLLFGGLRSGCHAYFNHSYICRARNDRDVSAVTCYEDEFCSAVARGNLYGVQFHPEKSQRVGMTILKNFMAL